MRKGQGIYAPGLSPEMDGREKAIPGTVPREIREAIPGTEGNVMYLPRFGRLPFREFLRSKAVLFHHFPGLLEGGFPFGALSPGNK